MTSIAPRGRQALAALLAAATIGFAFAPSAASAHDHHHFGAAAAGFGGALLLGALVAESASEREVAYERSCWSERREVVNYYGDVSYRRVRVCE